MSMQTFEQWMDTVESILWETGNHPDDQRYDFQGAYEYGTSPIQAAIEALFDVSIDLGGVHQ